MRVPDKLLLGVGFVGETVTGSLSSDIVTNLIGTAFVVSLPAPLVPGLYVYYVITAKHLFRKTPNTELVVIVNRQGGGIMTLTTVGGWHCHPDASVDVAVAYLLFDPSAAVTSFAISDFFDPADPGEIGIGDEVFFPSLFSFAYGDEQKIQPILRHGNLAMLPSKQVQTEYGFADVYLIEARSIGGISGAPVYIRETLALRQKHSKTGEERLFYGLGGMKLLGLMYGHWDIDPFSKNVHTMEADARRGVNVGIAMVVPASKILEVLNLPQVVAFREEQQRDYVKKSAPREE